MLENCKTAQERWGGVSNLIDNWLKERQEVRVTLYNLSDIAHDDASQSRGTLLQKLCQEVVDYVSAGHFEVFKELIKEAEAFDDRAALEEGQKGFEYICKTTELILDFNDKYQEVDDLEAISEDLSNLAECLADRIEAEDKIIQVMHTAHKDLVTI